MGEDVNFYNAGAPLADMDVLDVAALRLLFRLECSGEDFYNGVAERIAGERAAELLRQNGREEIGHANRLRRAIVIKLGHSYEPDATDLERFAVPLPDQISVEMLPLIVQGEIDADTGYQRWADNEADAEVAHLLRLNGLEEKTHAERVDRVIALLKGDDTTL
jgi:rubrerythrin